MYDLPYHYHFVYSVGTPWIAHVKSDITASLKFGIYLTLLVTNIELLKNVHFESWINSKYFMKHRLGFVFQHANFINPRPAGPLDFPPPAGGGGVWTPPPWSRLLVAIEKKRKAAFESSRKNHFEIISVIFWLRSKLGSPGVKIPKFSETVFRQ